MKKRIPILVVGAMFVLFAYTILTTPVKTPPDYTPPVIPHTIRTVGAFMNYPALWTGFWIMKKSDSTSLPAVAATFLLCFSAWGGIVYIALKKGIALTSS
jgi:hypothetical protein